MNTLFEELHTVLEQRKQELLAKMSKLMKEKLNALSDQAEHNDMAAGMIQRLMKYVQQNIEKATEEELLCIHAQILDQVDKEAKKHEKMNDLEPVEVADLVVEVKCVEELRKLCHDKSTVVSSPVDPARSKVEGYYIKTAEVNKPSKAILQVAPMCGKQLKKPVSVKANLKSTSNGAIFPAKVKKQQIDTYEIEYTPQVLGHHHLEVTVNGLHIEESPLAVFVASPSADV